MYSFTLFSIFSFLDFSNCGYNVILEGQRDSVADRALALNDANLDLISDTTYIPPCESPGVISEHRVSSKP